MKLIKEIGEYKIFKLAQKEKQQYSLFKDRYLIKLEDIFWTTKKNRNAVRWCKQSIKFEEIFLKLKTEG